MKQDNTFVVKPEKGIVPSESMPQPASGENAIFFNKDLFAQAQRAAELLSNSRTVPEQYRKNLPDCFIALASANRLNVDVFAYMQNSYVVHGRPGIEAKLVIALVNTRGPFEGPIQWEMSGEGDERECTAYATHAKTGERCEATVTWKMVEAEGWNKDKGSIKSKWATLPDLMFRYRSATFLARLYCPEVIQGITTVEELHDINMLKDAGGTYKPAETQVEAEDPTDKFTEKFIDNEPETVKQGITKAVSLLAKKFNMDEAEIKGNALIDPEGFMAEVEKVCPGFADEDSDSFVCPVVGCGFVAKSERGLKKHITQSHPTKEPEKEPPTQDLDETSDPITTALETGKAEKEQLQNEPKPMPGQVADLCAYLDSCSNKESGWEQIKKSSLDKLCRSDQKEIEEYYHKVADVPL